MHPYMAGIYLHIPFCKQACHYCDFHFSTSLKNKPEMVSALIQELSLRKDYLPENTLIETIYFGGGTPSLLNEKELEALFNAIYQNFRVAENAEITLEANPDDLNTEKLKSLKSSPVNRLSIGIQSFFEEDLRWMNRAHNAEEAERVLENAFKSGFTNISADLIFGYPLLTDAKWERNINHMLQSGIKHLSAYNMTVEKGTPLAGFIRKKQTPTMDEDQSAGQFVMLMEMMKNFGWEQYEISNYAKKGCYSKHNTNYWKAVPYLGIGPSAHSFDGKSRQWNTRVNNRYIQKINSGNLDFDIEILTPQNQLNEYIMTALRTQWGIQLEVVETKFGKAVLDNLLEKCIAFQAKDQIHLSSKEIILTTTGKLYADHLASALFE